MSFPIKSCSLDPVTTFILQEFKNILLPLVTQTVNASLPQGRPPDSQKHAIVMLLLKKPGLDNAVMNNLSSTSKLIKRVVLPLPVLVWGTVCCCSFENREFRSTVLKLYWRRFVLGDGVRGALRLIVKSARYKYAYVLSKETSFQKSPECQVSLVNYSKTLELAKTTLRVVYSTDIDRWMQPVFNGVGNESTFLRQIQQSNLAQYSIVGLNQ